MPGSGGAESPFGVWPWHFRPACHDGRMNRAERFVTELRDRAQDGDVLGLLSEDAEGFGAALDQAPEALHAALTCASSADFGPPVMVHDDCFASAACDGDGYPIVASPRLSEWFSDYDPFGAAVRDLDRTRPRVSLLADDKHGRPVALVAGTLSIAERWPLHADVRAALDSGKAKYAIAAFHPGELSLSRAARAYALTEAEALLVGALARQGDLQRAAAERGIAYETARKFVASAMRKTGSNRQTELIRRTLSVAAGDIPDAQSLSAVARDLFSLSERQADLATLVAHGATRERAAEVLGVSAHVAKADLKAVFQACGVGSAVELARIMAEINALKGLASACDVVVSSAGRDGEPLRFIPRRWSEGQIALADHGPEERWPLLLFHSNVSGRHMPAAFITALQQDGFRPIAIDRAGYGLTDPVPGDPVAAGVSDVIDVLDALGLPTAAVLARCTTASLVACAAAQTGRVTGGVLLWPDPPPRSDRLANRMSHIGRRIYRQFPHMAAAFARMVCNRTSVAKMEATWRKACEGIAVDQAILDDPVGLADIIRGSHQAIHGRLGFVNEALALGDGPRPARIDNAARWTAMFGEGYERFDVPDAMAFWGQALPGGTITCVERGVHFLHMTNQAEVRDALRRAV